MNEIKLKCPHCEEIIAVDDSALGTTIHCPHCAGPVNLPKRKAPPPEAMDASFVQEDAPPSTPPGPPPAPEEEADIFDLSPRFLAYLGRIVWNLLWIAAGFAAYSYLSGLTSLADIKGLGDFADELGKYQLSSHAPYLGLIISLFGVLGLFRVWVESTFNRYRLTTERLFLRTGFIARRSEEVELFRIKDVSVRQSLLHRMVGAGVVTILSTDDSTPYVVLHGVPRPEEVKEQVRQASRAARKREGMRAAEFIHS